MAQKKKRTVDRRKVWDFLGLVPSATELHARRLQWYQNLLKDPTAHQNVFFSFSGEASFESDTIFDESGRLREFHHVGELGNGRKTWMVLECLTMALFFLNVVEVRWGSGFWTVRSGRILASWT